MNELIHVQIDAFMRLVSPICSVMQTEILRREQRYHGQGPQIRKTTELRSCDLIPSKIMSIIFSIRSEESATLSSYENTDD